MQESIKVPDFQKLVQENLGYIIAKREYIHAHPELSGQEYNTSQLVYEELIKFGVENVRMIAETGVTGLIRGQLPGPVILLRADMDALPLQEQTNVSYCSTVDGVMHACGHDGHTASLLGVAKILMENRQGLRGTIKLAFQPAEEGAGGAKRMIDAGILQSPDVDYALGFHVDGDAPEGQIGVRSGALFSSCDDIVIKLKGVGGHGSRPYLTVNPIHMGLEVIQRMNTLLSQGCEAKLGSVLSFGQFNAGFAGNVIPHEAELKASLRTCDQGERNKILEKLKLSLQHAAEFYGGDYEVEIMAFAPICFNNQKLTESITKLLGEYYYKDAVVIRKELMAGSEDFAFFSQAVPSFFYMLGVRQDKEILFHHPEFQWESKALQYSCFSMLNIAYYLVDFIDADCGV